MDQSREHANKNPSQSFFTNVFNFIIIIVMGQVNWYETKPYSTMIYDTINNDTIVLEDVINMNTIVLKDAINMNTIVLKDAINISQSIVMYDAIRKNTHRAN